MALPANATTAAFYRQNPRRNRMTGLRSQRGSVARVSEARISEARISEARISGTKKPQAPAHSLRSFKRHEQINLRNSGLWRIHKGYVRTLTWSPEGESVPLGFWSRGDIVGYPVAQVHPYEVQCLTAVEAEYLGLNYAFSRDTVLAQVQQSNDLLSIAHCRTAEQRLEQFLCWLAVKFGQPIATGQQILIRLTHQEIAESIGITRVTVTRLLKTLEKAEKICWSVHQKIVYRSTLERSYAYACSCHRRDIATGMGMGLPPLSTELVG